MPTVLCRSLVGAGAVLVACVSALHSTGTEAVRKAVSLVELSAFMTQSMPVLWIHFSWHLGAIGAALAWNALAAPRAFRAITAFCAVIVLGDFLFVFSIAGWFLGTYGLATVFGLLAAAAAMTSSDDRSSDGESAR